MFTALLALVSRTAWSHPCDPEAATACPFDGGARLGLCLRDPSKHEAETSISAECQAFLDLHDACAENLDSGTCGGTKYSDDTVLCLTQWLNRNDLTDSCKAALPEPEAPKEKVLDEEAQRKRDARKRARAKAADEVRKLSKKQEEEASTKKKKKSKKADEDIIGYDDL